MRMARLRHSPSLLALLATMLTLQRRLLERVKASDIGAADAALATRCAHNLPAGGGGCCG